MPYIPCPITDPLELDPKKRYRLFSAYFFKWDENQCRWQWTNALGKPLAIQGETSPEMCVEAGCPLQVWTEEPQQIGGLMPTGIVAGVKKSQEVGAPCEVPGDEEVEVMSPEDLLPATAHLMRTFGQPMAGRRETHEAILAAQDEMAKVEKHWRHPDPEEPQPFEDSEELPSVPGCPALERVHRIEHMAGKKYLTLEKAQEVLDSIFAEAYAAIEEWPDAAMSIEQMEEAINFAIEKGREIRKLGATKQEEEVKGS